MISTALQTDIELTPIAEMQRLFSNGFSLLPLGGGDDGKSPLVGFSNAHRLPLRVVRDRMATNGSTMYALRLKGMMVVDCDTDNEQTRAYVQNRFGLSLVTVKTPRGMHYYFKAGDKRPKNVRQPNIEIDFKTGANSYVAGPYSVRPDGGKYRPEGEHLQSIDELLRFTDSQPDTHTEQTILSGKVAVGNRTNWLWRIARDVVECVSSEVELFAELRAYANYQFEDAANYSDADIRKAVKWVWQKRLQNDLWGGSISAVQVYNHEFEILMAGDDGLLGLALLYCLRHNHSGDKRGGKPFRIVREAMAEADTITGWKSHQYRRAIKALVNAGLIKCVREGNRFIGPSLFMFSQPTEAGGEGFLLHSGHMLTPKIKRGK